LRDFIEYIAKHIVDNPDDVRLEETLDEGVTRYRLFVNDAETGKIIGKQGKTAKAIRTLLKVVSAKDGIRCSLEIPDVIKMKKN
jgi:hypothetical protein